VATEEGEDGRRYRGGGGGPALAPMPRPCPGYALLFPPRPVPRPRLEWREMERKRERKETGWHGGGGPSMPVGRWQRHVAEQSVDTAREREKINGLDQPNPKSAYRASSPIAPEFVAR
jgi:hypothetical protein